MTGAPPPAPVVATPASSFSALRGRRVIVGVPGVGFRGDFRADNAVVRGGQTYVPVLTELDYYRAEIEQVEAFAPLVPVHRVWVEHVRDSPGPAPADPSTLDAPPPAIPVPAADAGRLTGRRVVRSVPDGHLRDLRAVTEIYRSDRGTPSVRVCDEAPWYAWAIAGTVPTTIEVDARLLWVE